MRARFPALTFLLAAVALSMLSACGGGDRKSKNQPEPPPATASSNWDQLTWEQGQWN